MRNMKSRFALIAAALLAAALAGCGETAVERAQRTIPILWSFVSMAISSILWKYPRS